jgi:polysaccharide pyruvyl transferase WcaK-like protein
MKILCCGFYGHGNAGDEAIAHALDFYLRRPFDNVELSFSTEMAPADAAKAAERLPFYKEHKLLSIYDLETIKEPDIFLVGGGDLSASYGIQQAQIAREVSRCRLLARIGTSAKDDFLKGGPKSIELVKASLGLFDYTSVRDRSSFDVLAALGVQAHCGADLGLDTRADASVKLPNGPYAVVVVREVREGDADRQATVAAKVVEAVRREFDDKFVLLPFCAADRQFAKHVSAACGNAMIWDEAATDPHKLVHIIANASYVVSVGRLHPLVFAVGNRVPCFGITYPWMSGYDKINGFMHHGALGRRVADWGLPPEEIGAIIHDAIRQRAGDVETLNVYSGYLKGLMLESLCPVWSAMEGGHGLGLERGMKAGEFQVDDYDESYYFGARVFKAGTDFRVYHPTRGDWEGWDVIRRLILQTMKPETLMDAGCGRGWFLQRMIQAGVKAEGIDTSRAAYSTCAPGVKEHFKVGTFQDLAHRRFDVVTAFDVMEHVFEEDLETVIATLKKCAGKFLVLNICAAPDDEKPHTISKGKAVPEGLEWLAVSGHVTIRHRSWWKAKLEDDDWKVDEDIVDGWFDEPKFDYPSWKRHNLVILRRKRAAS